MTAYQGPGFDAVATLARVAGDRQLLAELVALYRKDTPLRVAAVARAVAARDLDAAQRAAHGLKGAAMTFGAERALATAQRVEELAAVGESAALTEAVAELEDEHARLCRELAEYIAAG